MALADFEVGVVVGGGNFDGASAECLVNKIVGDNWDFSVGEREFDGFADELLVTGVVGVDSDGGVAEHGFGASGAEDKLAVTVG